MVYLCAFLVSLPESKISLLDAICLHKVSTDTVSYNCLSLKVQ